MPFGGMTAMADSEIDPENLNEGVYKLEYTFLEKGKDSASTMDNFTEGPAYVKVDKAGHQFVAVTFTSASMIQWFKVNGQDVTNLQEDEANDTKVVEFKVNNLTEKQAGNVFVEVPGVYSTEHEVDLEFVVDSLETLEASDYPENEKSEEPGDSGDENGSEDENDDEESEDDSEDTGDETGSEDENEDNGSENESEDNNEPEDGTENSDNDNESEDGENGSDSEEPNNDSDSEDESDSDGSENESDENDEAEEPLFLEDGTYEVDFTVTYPGMDVDEYFTKPAILNVENGTQYIQIEHNSIDIIKALSIPNGDVDVISEDEDNDTRVVGFDVDGDLSESAEMGMVMSYGMTHDVQVDFDIDSIQMIEQPKEPETPDSELDPDNLSKGVYSLDYTFLKKGEDAASSMDGFTDGPAYVKVDEDGNQFVALTLTSAEMIQWFKVNDEYATVLQEDKNTRVVEFKVDNLTEKQDGNIYVEVPNMYSTEHEVDLVFDTNSLQTAKDSDYPEDHNIGQSPKPVNPEGEGNDDLGKPSGDDNDEKPGTLYEKSELIPDKAYEIDFVIKHETEDRISAADEFFKKPGILLYKDGEKYLQLTVTNSDMIQSLSAGGKDVLIVQENADGSKVIQFKVAGAISDVIDLNMFISVPGLYDMEHNARLFLDPDSQKEVDVGDYLLVAGSENNPNGPLVENGDSGGTIGEKTPKKPEFGDNGDTDKNADDDTVKPDKTDNPQTGDTTNIFLYAMLLIGSFIPLAIKLRRRFI